MNPKFHDVTLLSSNLLISKFEKVVEHNFSDHDLDLKQMASEMGLSERQLQRKIKTLTGRSPTEFVRAFRLSKSRDYLLAGYAVHETAKLVGFASQAYFAACFKASYGKTPTEYRDKHA